MSSTREYREALAARVKQAREDANYTQETIARLLRLSQPTYSKYEGGRGNEPPSILPTWLLLDFCDICQVSLEWLVSGRDSIRQIGPPGRPRIGPRRRSVK